MGGEVGANIQKIYSYGHRNAFGMAFDPVTGVLWETENADDAFSELNRVVPGMNGGWIQIAGPLSRFAEFKSIETTQFNSALQQVRYPPTRVAYTAALALSRMFMLPGRDLRGSRIELADTRSAPPGRRSSPATRSGAEYNGTLWIGSARSFQQVGGNGGSLYRLRLTPDRLHVDVSADPRLADRVADNLFRAQKFDGTESETLQIGTGFGTTPDIDRGRTEISTSFRSRTTRSTGSAAGRRPTKTKSGHYENIKQAYHYWVFFGSRWCAVIPGTSHPHWQRRLRIGFLRTGRKWIRRAAMGLSTCRVERPVP